MEPSPRRPGGRAAGLRVAEGCAGPAGGQPTGRDKVADGSHSVDQGAGAAIHWDPLDGYGSKVRVSREDMDIFFLEHFRRTILV